jgi:hypothetical protein
MARRKEDKLRPYRVDYFDIDQMIDNDRALIRSQVVRAVTSAEAQAAVQNVSGDSGFTVVNPAVIVIRSYRYYKKLGQPKRNVYKAIEDLFTSNKAVKIMDEVEAYRKRKEIDAQFMAAHTLAPVDVTMGNNGHQTRFSDSSLYDEVCINCGGTDGRDGGLDRPCPNAPTTGPDSPATKAVVADLAGMTAHDEHEQVMETFIPNPNQPDISKFDLDAAAPILNPAPDSGDEIAAALVDKTTLPPNHPDHVCTDKCYDFALINDPLPGVPVFDRTPEVRDVFDRLLLTKLALFGGVVLIAIILVLAILHGGK